MVNRFFQGGGWKPALQVILYNLPQTIKDHIASYNLDLWKWSQRSSSAIQKALVGKARNGVRKLYLISSPTHHGEGAKEHPDRLLKKHLWMKSVHIVLTVQKVVYYCYFFYYYFDYFFFFFYYYYYYYYHHHHHHHHHHWMGQQIEQGVEEAVQEKEGHAAILAAVPASIQAEFGLPTTCPIYVRDAWIAPGSEHLKQLSLVCTAILKRQAEALTSLPPGKSCMCEKEDLQNFGLLQRVCEHTRCPTQLRQTPPRVFWWNWSGRTWHLKPCKVCRNFNKKCWGVFLRLPLLPGYWSWPRGLSRAKGNRALQCLFHAISPALAGLLKINPEKYQKQKSATWPSEAELVWNLLLAAGKAFEMEEEEAAADTEDEAPEPSPAEEEAEDPEIPPTRRSYSCSTRGRPHCRLCF